MTAAWSNHGIKRVLGSKSVPSLVLSYYGAKLKGLYIQLILQGLNHVLYVGWQLLLKLAAGACTSKLPATL